MTFQLSRLLEQAAQRNPDKTFIIAEEQRLTFAQVNQQADRFAQVLSGLGVKPGDIVALLLPNIPLFPICYYGALKLGAVVLLLSARSAGPEVGFALRDTGVSVLVSVGSLQGAAVQGWSAAGSTARLLLAGLREEDPCPPTAYRLEELLAATRDDWTAPAVEVSAESDAVILFTSGTTAQPKGVRLSHGNFEAITPQFAELCGLTADDVLLSILPVTVIIGQILVNLAAYLGATLCLMNGFDPRQLLSVIRRDRVAFFPAVPLIANMLLASPAAAQSDLASLRSIMIGATHVPPELVERFSQRFNVPVVIPYGLTECSVIAMALPGMQSPAGSVGQPIPGTTVRIVDEHGRMVAPNEPGEILVRSPHVMPGYFNRPAETAAAFSEGWLRTGDLGYMDDEGFLFIADRINDLIKTAGYRVFPAEVERVLEMHPAVAQAAVVGQPHTLVGEVVQANIVLKPGTLATVQELKDHCRRHLASFKRPRQIVFVEQLPRNATGKVLRRMLRHAA